MRWILVDGTWMAHVLKYGLMNSGSIEDSPELILYGYLDALRRICVNRRIDSVNLQIFVDTSTSRRKALDPSYKLNRQKKEKTCDEIREDRCFWEHMEVVWSDHLPKIGVPVHKKDGFEADDLIAMVCYHISAEDDVIIITADGDLWQCLRHNVDWYNPYTDHFVTESEFRRTVGVRPQSWATVKSIAGCSGDNVKGVPGVGEKSAIKFLRGNLSVKSVYYKRINCPEGEAAMLHADRLVRLPFEGTPSVALKSAKWNRSYFTQLCNNMGFSSLIRGWLALSWNEVFGKLSLRDLQEARRPTRAQN